MVIDTLHPLPASRRPLPPAPAATSHWHAWLRVLALTVVAVGLGLTFSAASAHADTGKPRAAGEQPALLTPTLKHRASATERTPSLGETLTSTLDHTTAALTSTTSALTETTSALTKPTPAATKTTRAATKTTNDAVSKTTDAVSKTVHTTTSALTGQAAKSVGQTAIRSTVSAADQAVRPQVATRRHPPRTHEPATTITTNAKSAPTTKAGPNAESTPGTQTTRPVPKSAPSKTTATRSNTDAVDSVLKLVDDTALRPTADLVAAVGTSRPIGRVVDTTNAVLHATTEPAQLLPTVIDTVSAVTPAPLHTTVAQLGETTAQVAAPVTTVIASTQTALEPVVGVRGLATGVTDDIVVPVDQTLATAVDDTLPAVTTPVAKTVRHVDQHVRTIVTSTGSTAASPLNIVAPNLGLHIGQPPMAKSNAHGPHQKAQPSPPPGQLHATGSARGGHAPRSPLMSLHRAGQANLPIATAPLVRTDPRPAPITGVAKVTATAGGLVDTTRSSRGDGPTFSSPRIFTSTATHSDQPAATSRSSRVADGNSNRASAAAPADSGTAISFAQGATGSVSSATSAGSSANAPGSGAAQTAAVPTALTVLDLRGADPIGWHHESGTIRAAYDPGFSPD